MPKDERMILLGIGLASIAAGVIYSLTRGKKPSEPPPGLANLYGTVSDIATGKAVPGALVTLDGMQVTADSVGYYQFIGLEPGYYQIQCLIDGYEQWQTTLNLPEGNREENIEMTPITTIVEFSLGIKNYPAESYQWNVQVTGGNYYHGMYPMERMRITAPSIATLTIEIEQEEPHWVVFREAVLGIFDNNKIYDFNCATLQFEEVPIPEWFIQASVSSPMPSGGDGQASLTVKLPLSDKHYWVRLVADIREILVPGIAEKTLVNADFWPPQYYSGTPWERVLDSPDDIYTIEGAFQAVYEIALFPNIYHYNIPPGVYPVIAHVYWDTCVGVGEVGLPDGHWITNSIATLVVT